MHTNTTEYKRVKPPKNGFQSLAELREYVANATNQWLWSWTKASVDQHIHKLLDPQIESLIFSIIGLRKDIYGGRKWEVDHCNGRSSTLKDLVSERAKSLLAVWLDEHLESVLKQPFNKTEIASLQREYREVLFSKIRDQIRQQATEDATSMVTHIAKLGTESELDQLIEESRGLDLLVQTLVMKRKK